MPELSGIYDSAYVQPVAKIRENIAIWTLGAWNYFMIDYQEPIPPTPASQVDMCVQALQPFIAGNATISKRIVTILQLNENEFLHVRFEPLDNVEGVIWEQAGQQKMSSKNIQSRVDRRTRQWDPSLSTTTFFILGINRDMNLECRNPLNYPQVQARFQFWGNRMILMPLSLDGIGADQRSKLKLGDLATVKTLVGPVTWLPAEGKQA